MSVPTVDLCTSRAACPFWWRTALPEQRSPERLGRVFWGQLLRRRRLQLRPEDARARDSRGQVQTRVVAVPRSAVTRWYSYSLKPPILNPARRRDENRRRFFREAFMASLARINGVLGFAACLFAFAAQAQDVVSLDPVFDQLVAPDAKVEIVKGGFGFTEGPVWVQKGKTGYLLFSDIPANVIYKLTPAGEASVYLDHSGYTKADIWRVGFEFNNGKDPNDPAFAKFYMNGSNGLALDPQGRLVIATFAGRSIDRIEPNGKRTVLADSYDGKRFNGTNDVVVKKDGAVYFTDMFGALRQGDKDPGMGLPYQAIYMVKNSKVTRLTDDIPTTNGLAFSPDEKHFYANGSRGKFIRRYDVKPDGTLTNSQMLI